MRATTQKAGNDVEAAQNFFGDEKPKEKKPEKKSEDSGKIAALERSLKQLTDRIDIIKQQNKVELKHAKEKAKEMYEEMMEQKLTACRKAYEEEFEVIAKQFEEFKDEIDDQRQKWANVQALAADQENQIVNMNNMIETVGHNELVAMYERRMSEPIDGNEQEDLMNFVAEMNDNPDSVHSDLIDTVKYADKLLAKPFNFYSVAINLNVDDQIDIANRSYIRYYKKKINDVLMDKDAVQTELDSNQRMLNTFKMASEKSARKIIELELRENIVQEERITLMKDAERKVNRMSKEYIALYKQLSEQFAKYKEFIIFELESHEMIREGLEKVIRGKEGDIDELKEALSVPRQHYKFIDNLAAEEIIKQKNEIVAEMANNMGVPENKLLEVLYRSEAARDAKNSVKQALKEDAKA